MAHDVVAAEVEGAAEVVARMLRWIEAPRNLIDERIQVLRALRRAMRMFDPAPAGREREEATGEVVA